MRSVSIYVLFSSLICLGQSSLPVVLWHGMGDSSEGSIKFLIELLEKELPGSFVKSIRIGSNEGEDFMNSYFKNANQQIKMACDILLQESELLSGFNFIGFSQGGQFARAAVQRCSLPVKNLITLGGQHRGVYGIPRCPGSNVTICNYIRRLLNFGAYESFVQDNLGEI